MLNCKREGDKTELLSIVEHVVNIFNFFTQCFYDTNESCVYSDDNADKLSFYAVENVINVNFYRFNGSLVF